MTDKQCECPSMFGDTCHMGEGCRAFEMVKRFSLQQAGAQDSGKKLAQQLERLSGITPPGDECTDRYLNAIAESVVRRGFSCVFDDLKRVTAERDAMAAKLAELECQLPVAWLYDWQAPEGLIRDWSTNSAAEIPEHATHIRPLYARPAPADPVNARLLSALIQCRDRFVFYVGHHLDKGDLEKAAENEKFVALANEAIAATAEPVNARLLDVATGKIVHIYAGLCPDVVNGPASRDPSCQACQAISAATTQQERNLQDMYDAGREIDRMMVNPIARAIETATLRKNGISEDGGDEA